jgi:ABC-type antimicrobial peptide transport system permease subunit
MLFLILVSLAAAVLGYVLYSLYLKKKNKKEKLGWA